MEPTGIAYPDTTVVVILLLENGIAIGPFKTKEEARDYKSQALPHTPATPVQCIPPC